MVMESLLEQAVIENRLDLLVWLWKNSNEKHDILFNKLDEVACEYGNLEILKWLIKENFSKYHNKKLSIAIQLGHINIVKYFIEELEIVPVKTDLEKATKNLEMFEYIYNNLKII